MRWFISSSLTFLVAAAAVEACGPYGERVLFEKQTAGAWSAWIDRIDINPRSRRLRLSYSPVYRRGPDGKIHTLTIGTWGRRPPRFLLNENGWVAIAGDGGRGVALHAPDGKVTRIENVDFERGSALFKDGLLAYRTGAGLSWIPMSKGTLDVARKVDLFATSKKKRAHHPRVLRQGDHVVAGCWSEGYTQIVYFHVPTRARTHLLGERMKANAKFSLREIERDSVRWFTGREERTLELPVQLRCATPGRVPVIG